MSGTYINPFVADRLNWLDEVVVINDSEDERYAGDVSIHRSEGDALSGLEAFPVAQGEVHAFTASGVRLTLDISGEVVFISGREECPDGPEIVLSWLQALARTTLEARIRVAEGGRVILSRAEEEGALPDTLEGLLAYNGFPWVAPRDWFVPSCLLLLAIIAALLTFLAVKVI